MTKYEKGAVFERKIATFFRRSGYYVTRSAGSKGPADLVAMKRRKRTLLIQCKIGVAIVDKEEQNTLFEAADMAGARALIVTKKDREPIVFQEVVDYALKQGDGIKTLIGFKGAQRR